MIPGVSVLVGAGFAIKEAMAGNYKKAALELASGVVGTIPFAGPALGIALSVAGGMYLDNMDEEEKQNKEQLDNLSKTSKNIKDNMLGLNKEDIKAEIDKQKEMTTMDKIAANTKFNTAESIDDVRPRDKWGDLLDQNAKEYTKEEIKKKKLLKNKTSTTSTTTRPKKNNRVSEQLQADQRMKSAVVNSMNPDKTITTNEIEYTEPKRVYKKDNGVQVTEIIHHLKPQVQPQSQVQPVVINNTQPEKPLTGSAFEFFKTDKRPPMSQDW